MTNYQAVTQESSKTIQCGHCTLVLKSKVYLFEHLNKDHGFGVDVALSEAGFRKSATDKAANDNNNSSSACNFEFHHCVANGYEAQCQLKSENQNVMGNQINSDNSQRQIDLMSHNKGNSKANVISAFFSAMPTSKTKCILNASKEPKICNRPLDTINKCIKVTPESDETPPTKLCDSPEPCDGTTETLILEKSPSDSCPTSSGVFKVSAKSVIDVSKCENQNLFSEDRLQIPNLRQPDRIGKRSNNESSKSPPKKFKSETKDGKLPEEANGPREQQLSNTELSFKCGEDEEKKKVNLVNGNVERPDVYFCKHCDYSDGTISRLSTHYQNDHPYIKFRVAYIQDPKDQSATFRCLECPVEFLSTAILKKHYNENHAWAPNVFTMQSHEFYLVFKCFVCPFFTNTLTGLKEHYKETHPKHNMDNSLMYCRYSMTRCQEGPSHLMKCENVPSPEKSQEIHHKSSHTPCKEVKNASFPQQRTSKGENLEIYHCNNCKFSHKSVVVMHVHYKRNHPDVAVTIDKIKRSACVTMDTMQDKSPKFVPLKEKSALPKTTPESSEKTEKQKEISLSLSNSRHTTDISKTYSESTEVKSTEKTEKQKEISSSLSDSRHTTDISKTYSESTKVKSTEKTEKQEEISLSLSNSRHTPDISKTYSESTEVKSTEVRRKGPKSRSKSKVEKSTRTGSSQNEMFYCQFCNFSSSTIKSVIGHHNAKHAALMSTHTEDVLLYSANVQNEKRQAEASAGTTSSDSKTAKQREICGESKLKCEGDDAIDDLVTNNNPYASPEDLFYCQECNFGNTSAQGVVNHQTKAHRSMNINSDLVLEHTYWIREEIEKSKSQAKDVSLSNHLPLPLINQHETDLLFCHFCNYRHGTMHVVLRHYGKRHRGFATDAEQIRKHSARILSKTKELHLKKPGSQEDIQTSLGKKELNTKMKVHGKHLTSPARASKTRRPLCCPKCPYNTRYAYLLKKHTREAHKSNHLAAADLRLCHKQGTSMNGYHCELCAFSHTKAKVVFKHYQEQHPGCKRSLNYVTTKLYVSPKAFPSKKGKPRKKHTDVISDGEDTGDSLPAQSSGQIETTTFSCRACSFKGSSLSSITDHYRAVHPWSVKEDGSVLHLISSKKHSGNRKVQDEKDMPVSLETYHTPLHLEKSKDSSHRSMSSKKFNCPMCFAVFPSQHGLTVHCGIKHREATPKDLDEPLNRLQIQRDVYIFKCPHCTYVNTNHQGVVKHSKMKHPALELMIDSLYVDEMNLQEMEDCVKMKSTGLRIRGHMCKICPQICSTLGMLTMHCKEDHAEPEKPKSAPKPSDVTRKKLKTSSKVALSKRPFSKSNYAGIWCQYCSFRGTTKSAIARHLQVCHNGASVSGSKDQDVSYKCVLCSNFYFKKNCLGMHYAKKHGREAFLKYYASIYKLVQKKPAPTVPEKAMPQQPDNNSDVCKSRTKAKGKKKKIFKCPACRYVNASYHGTLTHCQMKHPEIVVRADELQTDELDLSNMSGHPIGKGSTLGGYACRLCPLVHASLKKLKIHCDQDHQRAKGAASKCSAKSKKRPRYGCRDSELEVVQPNTPPVQDDKIQFLCSICTYEGSCRRYLHTHYKNCHKLDSFSASKMLVKYNKRSINQPAETQSEQIPCVKCKLCPNVEYDSFQPLIDHYITFHRSDFKLDFIVLSPPSKKTTGLFKCSLCNNKQLNGIRKLRNHLNCHHLWPRRTAKFRNCAGGSQVKSDIRNLHCATESPAVTFETR
ncbi:zinc finger protein 462-like [Brachionichthys hirsutus]|uniref:zinc finger protein 462-like n=1 Tax=Brachionichthys hirsutus TaxID=412623 RepID=UPI003604442F